MDQEKLDQQSQQWEKSFSDKPEMFGREPSKAAIEALKKFKKEKITSIIEFGAGLGRDTIFFAQNSIYVEALDYSPRAIEKINKKAKKLNLSNFIKTKVFDVRKKLPFDNKSFQGSFSHMLYCMALTFKEIINLNNEIFRILKTNGLNIYTARHINDGDYKNGAYIGEDLYENDGFIVHFFSKEKIKKISKNFKILQIKKFEEGHFPRKLYIVSNKKV